MPDLTLKAGDTVPAFVTTLKENGAPIPDLDDKTFTIRPAAPTSV